MKVLVLMGGMSAEREISLKTGAAVAAGLREAGHDVTAYDLAAEPGHGVRDLVVSDQLAACDVVFLALHGGEGEDGRIQALLDLMGKPYTGSGVLASALCMEKSLTKMLFERHGIATPPWFLMSAPGAARDRSTGGEITPVQAGRGSHPGEGVASMGGAGLGESKAAAGGPGLEEIVASLGGYPVVVKPVDQGSTIGITIVAEPGGLAGAIALAGRYSGRLIFEKYIAGRELSVAIVAGRVFPVVEIVPQGGFYDYERKYVKGKTHYHCPAGIDGGLAERISREAFAAYTLPGCEGFARVDLRLGEDGIPYFLEVNTIPGMTETSLVPMAAAEEGYSFSELVDIIVREALKRPRRA